MLYTEVLQICKDFLCLMRNSQNTDLCFMRVLTLMLTEVVSK